MRRIADGRHPLLWCLLGRPQVDQHFIEDPVAIALSRSASFARPWQPRPVRDRLRLLRRFTSAIAGQKAGLAHMNGRRFRGSVSAGMNVSNWARSRHDYIVLKHGVEIARTTANLVATI